MRLHEITELTPEELHAVGDSILEMLHTLEIDARWDESKRVLMVSRDSMVAAFPTASENDAYDATLDFIRSEAPGDIYLHWTGKTDDDYFLGFRKL